MIFFNRIFVDTFYDNCIFFRKFIEAAQRYNELSYRAIIHDEERMTCLRNALICTVLASAGKIT